MGTAEASRRRALRLRRLLAETWGPEGVEGFRAVRAPGRVNLIGEHTDYNQGLVLPVAVDLELWIGYHPTRHRIAELTSLALGETRAVDLDRPRPSSGGRSWVDYVAGVARALVEDGVGLRGIRGVVAGDLPVGSGLGSSAALEVAAAWALLDPEAGPSPGPARLARLAHRAESEYVGIRCGPMDQQAVALGRAGHAMLIDCRSGEVRPVPLPSDLALVVLDSGVPRRLADARYNERRAECEEAVRLLRARSPWIRSLRDVDPETLELRRVDLPAPLWRRAAHVVEENARVERAVRALEGGDPVELGRLLSESHASLRDLFEVSSPELEALVEVAGSVPGVVGVRPTGAGFGGSCVAVVRPGTVPALSLAVADRYRARTGREGAVRPVRAVDGAGPVEA